MSYSMLNTKRKFHRLLDSLANGGAGRGDSTTDNTDHDASLTREAGLPASKRRKHVPQQRSEFVTSNPQLSFLLSQQAARRSTSISSRSNFRTVMEGTGGSSQEATSGTTARLPPTTWNPWDKAAFMERMKTFKGVDWRLRAEGIDAVAFAKWGWTLVGDHTVQCVSCRQRWIALLPEERPENFHSDPFVEKTVPRLEEEHDEDCMWRTKHCKDSIYSLTMYPASRCVEALRDRYLAIIRHTPDLPYVLNAPDELTKDNDSNSLEATWCSFQKIFPTVNTNILIDETDLNPEGASPNNVMQRAFILALFGWDGIPLERNEPPEMGMLQCTQCQARIGLWTFRSRPRVSASVPGRVVHESLDVAEYHQMQCPWAVAKTQYADVVLDDGVSSKPAWEILRGMAFSQATTASRQARPGTATADTGAAVAGTPSTGRVSRLQNEEETGPRAADQDIPTAEGKGTRQAAVANGRSTITDEERKQKHKLNMSWLRKIKLGGKEKPQK